MTKDEALKLALETFEELLLAPQDVAKEAPPAITAIREVLAQTKQEPVAYTTGHCKNHKQKGGCQLHNLQCGWPDCDHKPITTPPQPEQKPVAKVSKRYVNNIHWLNEVPEFDTLLYTAPPQRKELEATERQVEMLSDDLSKCSKALKLALEALEAMQMYAAAEKKGLRICDEAIIAAEEALAQPEQQPVAHSVVEPLRHDEYQRRVSVKWVNQPVAGPLYTTPPQPKQEHVATFDEVWGSIDWDKWRMEPIRDLVKMIHSKTTPPQRTWVGLTDEEIWDLHIKMSVALNCKLSDLIEFARAYEAKLKDKNT